ncbi:phosphatase PAP2 family protein [Mycobacterium sp. OTB74]|jgi:membrane-associated phospholipid phosphatase|uniref:phosphatase PAP2 family protein n=1 Tax=Mycobacterium sp. OTB74 TaxID=1853452 RepID=UPI002475AC89|nr:phosphatase PAP2 family protein [Mycobacterium sp. OTB74]MDH6243146.1 membrane-associated phospholipid phosphatase [Mycobacterium sp. OTB74]
MVVLGLLVGTGATAVDGWFVRASQKLLGADPVWMLVFNQVWVLLPLLAVAVAITLRRRQWRLAVVMALCPPLAVVGARVLKVFFDRRWEGVLAYPSGHTTAVITVASMLVLALGVRWWTVAAAVVFSIIGSIAMASNPYHYFTDIIGGALYGTSMVCLAVLVAGPAAPSTAHAAASPGLTRSRN